MNRNIVVLLFFLICPLGFAEGEPSALPSDLGVGMEMSGFRVPDYDDEGNLRAQLFGEHVKMLEGGMVEITNLKIDLYRDGEIVATLFTPSCFFDINRKEARSEDRVLVDSDSATLTGRGFFWSAKSGRFEIFHDTKMLADSAAQQELKERW